MKVALAVDLKVGLVGVFARQKDVIWQKNKQIRYRDVMIVRIFTQN